LFPAPVPSELFDDVLSGEVFGGGFAANLDEGEPIPPDTPDVPAEPRRITTRVWEGDTVVKSVLPPNRQLRLGVRIAIPDPAEGDVAADTPIPPLPAAQGPTIDIEVVVRGTVWERPPEPRKSSMKKRT
jgi:hypothetical protein